MAGVHCPPKRRANSSAAYVLVSGAASVVVLLGFVGLAVDVGYLQVIKRRAQTAADSAALDGIQELKRNRPGDIVAAARYSAALNGFTHGTTGVTVQVNNPPTSGRYSGSVNAVESIVTQTAGTFFMRILNTNSVVVRARAVAYLGSSPNCLYVLNPTAEEALEIDDAAQVQLNCGAIVNSNHANAMEIEGLTSCFSATSIGVVGGYTVQGSCVPTPTPKTGVDPEPDPLAYLSEPVVPSNCNATNLKINGGNVVLTPGVYCNGIQISGGANVTFQPGNYILKGGGLQISGTPTVQGTGVSFYNANVAGYTYKGVNIKTTGSVQLSAPTTGPLAGILMFDSRSAPAEAESEIAAGANSKFEGALYFPKAELEFEDDTTATVAYTLIVADRVEFEASAKLTATFAPLPGGSPIKKVTLGE